MKGKETQLVERFSMEEVKEVVNSFEGNKSPGPYGYNLKFIQTFWYMLKKEVWGMVNEFYDYEKLQSCLSSYFVALIPTINNP